MKNVSMYTDREIVRIGFIAPSDRERDLLDRLQIYIDLIDDLQAFVETAADTSELDIVTFIDELRNRLED